MISRRGKVENGNSSLVALEVPQGEKRLARMDEMDESLNLAWQFLDRHLEAGDWRRC